MKTQADRAKLLILVGAVIAASALPWACGSGERVRQKSANESAFGVRIDRSDNGAAVQRSRSREDTPPISPRALAFEMTGFAKPAEPASLQEHRAAARQAAIIDALCKALLETRHLQGIAATDFTAELSPRLKVAYSKTAAGYKARITLVSRGVETAFEVRDGRLQHPPHDLRLVQQIFEETNGEFALLGADWSVARGGYVATVGCYCSRESESAPTEQAAAAQDHNAADSAAAQ
jgi:hypothetical protein